jgi:hypothetical protein
VFRITGQLSPEGCGKPNQRGAQSEPGGSAQSRK